MRWDIGNGIFRSAKGGFIASIRSIMRCRVYMQCNSKFYNVERRKICSNNNPCDAYYLQKMPKSVGNYNDSLFK